MQTARAETGRGGETPSRPRLPDVLIAVVQALVDQGWDVAEIVESMRYTADLTELADRVTGIPQ